MENVKSGNLEQHKRNLDLTLYTQKGVSSEIFLFKQIINN